MEHSAKLLEDSLLLIWNDRNADSRLKAMKETYANDIVFYESNEGDTFKGYKQINDLITNLQSKWPPEFMFELTTSSKINHQIQHISWKLGVPGQEPVATGIDVAIVENHRIKSLYLLLG